MEPAIAVTARCEIRSVIRFLNAQKLKPIEIHRQLEEVYGKACISVQHVRKWCREFSEGRTDVHNEQRSGRPSVSHEVVAKIECILLVDQRVTLRELADQVPEVCEKTIVNILTGKLGYHKVCARWVPHMLSETHKDNRVKCAEGFLRECAENTEEFLDSIITGDETWCHYVTPETKEQLKQWRHTGSPRPKKFKQTLSAGKVMATVFWDRKGVLLTEFMPKGTTINSDRYCETLTKLKRAIQNRRRGRLTKGIRLHHDNARPHVSRQTTALLDKFSWKLLDHAPYSPDLAPSDFHLFPKLKQHLGGQRFNTDEEVKEAVSKFIDGLAAEFFEEGFQKWITRQEKCVGKSGDYVEK